MKKCYFVVLFVASLIYGTYLTGLQNVNPEGWHEETEVDIQSTIDNDSVVIVEDNLGNKVHIWVRKNESDDYELVTRTYLTEDCIFTDEHIILSSNDRLRDLTCVKKNASGDLIAVMRQTSYKIISVHYDHSSGTWSNDTLLYDSGGSWLASFKVATDETSATVVWSTIVEPSKYALFSIRHDNSA